MKFRIVMLFALTFSSCQIDIEDNSRLLLKGDVSDGLQSPFPNLPVEVYASNGNGFLNLTERIGVGETAADGTFDVVALSPENKSYLQLNINTDFQEGYRSDLGSYTIRGFNLLKENDVTYTIPPFAIGKKTTAPLEIRRIDNLLDTLVFQYRYKNPDRMLDFSQNVFEDTTVDFNFYGDFGTLSPAQKDTMINLSNVIARDTLFFEYNFMDGNASESIEVDLLYNPENGGYVFEF
ncbi:MAG: hypothetical protein WBG48_00265 [Pricia sp.]